MAELTISVLPAAGTTALNRLAKLYNDESTSDVTFIVGPNNTEFFGHTVIIGAASDVFKTHFLGDWRDKKNIKLQDVKEDVFRVLMAYIYTDEIIVKKNNLLDVLQLAHFYMMTGLIKSLTNESTFKTYSTQCVWNYLNFAVNINDIELIIRCLEVIDKDPDAFSKPEFLNADTSTIGLFIGRNSLKISEYNLFKRLLDWSVYECRRRIPPLPESPANQRKVMDSWFHKIRFPLMDVKDFETIAKTGILTTSEVNLVKNAITSGMKDMTGFDFNPRTANWTVSTGCKGKETRYGLSFIMQNDHYYTNDYYIHICLPCAVNCHPSAKFGQLVDRGSMFECKCKENGLCKF